MAPPRSLHLDPPPSANGLPTSPSAQRAYGILVDAYDRANQLLRLEDGDPIRLRLHSDRVCSRVLPIILALGQEIGDGEWLDQCLQNFSSLVGELNEAAAVADQV